MRVPEGAPSGGNLPHIFVLALMQQGLSPFGHPMRPSPNAPFAAILLGVSATFACTLAEPSTPAGALDIPVESSSADDEDTNKALAAGSFGEASSPAPNAKPPLDDEMDDAAPDAPDGTPDADEPPPPPSEERQVMAKLGLTDRFLIGLGNDAEGGADKMMAYSLEQKLDIHYMYLSGLDWPTWNAPEGAYVTNQANAAKSRGIIPMFTLYQAAAYGENNLGAFATKEFMTKYWRGVRVMFERLGELGSAAIVHVEPDLWGYAQKRGDDPAAVPMLVGSLVPECKGLPENVAGMAKCVIRLSRAIAPKVVIGLSASSFGAYTNGESDPLRIAAYMKKLGATDGDITVVETLDRDAGCFERAVDPLCKRAGKFYWDESNVAHPNFHDHLAWAKAIRKEIGRPLLWWQMPLGVPAASAGSAARYRDNRVRYFFSHPGEFVEAGGIGAVFGTGAPNQTTIRTDGGQFQKAIKGYYAAPAHLP